MDKLQYTCLMMLSCFTLDSVYGEDEEMLSLCEVELMVRRNTTWRTSPQQSLTVTCPVKHCGEPLSVTWCKLSSKDRCEQIHQTENVEITQGYTEDALISYLTFKAISISDDGLYRCGVKNGYEISHAISISVSDLYQGVERSDSNPNTAPSLNSPTLDLSWLPYFCICFSLALMATVLTAMTHLSFHPLKETLSYKPSGGQEMSTCMIPGLPKRNDPVSSVLHTHITVLNDIYCPFTSATPVSPPSTIPNRSQPLASPANESQVYAAINHRQHPSAARKQHTQTKNPEYATISVP